MRFRTHLGCIYRLLLHAYYSGIIYYDEKSLLLLLSGRVPPVILRRTVVFGKNEFRNSSVRHCMGLKHLLLFVD